MKLLKIAAIGALALTVAGVAQAKPKRAPVFRPQLVLYAGPNFVGEFRILRASVPRLVDIQFNDRASSLRATGRWQVCTNPYYAGRCAVVRGGYGGLGGIQMSDKISSVRYIGP
ncbi:hypothetical protein QO010_002309 [Caulobacter ginsengisoli]|uniref:Beta/gamma crystallin 'Greek key' domain-containing protein n=1 Tax=Caulobacter ginsengisoli TaxID=400775 RepID=A0ABU0IR84_9CAUL|nr:beta/gamma crystallin-related protein [Caulobacter ginsengisoli]MDQ0464528.1 hypothetical protein [Caulobacter ginsengisoli]